MSYALSGFEFDEETQEKMLASLVKDLKGAIEAKGTDSTGGMKSFEQSPILLALQLSVAFVDSTSSTMADKSISIPKYDPLPPSTWEQMSRYRFVRKSRLLELLYKACPVACK
ncbi:hypothetical protein Q3G72_034708 [Acer saccharum]|nr:hypothetical protein Q3G72_034708 [Acer saccharum]